MTNEVPEKTYGGFWSNIEWESSLFSIIVATIIGQIITCIVYKYRKLEARKTYLSELIQSIVGDAESHWCNSPQEEINRARCLMLQRNIRDLSWRIGDMSKDVEAHFIQFRMEITGDNFTEPNRSVYDFVSEKVDKINLAARNLRRSLGIKKDH
jgi:hypothetical protein